ncbi:MAG TPA: ABC transporter substrate-binding protein [Burkholderiales bacterium]|nr:ABC transporter substrate-binding protein [Burkholderiales bacterium]
MSVSKSLVNEFAPTGRLRAVINVGNPILAGINPETQQPFGVSVDLANELAKRLGVNAEYTVVDAAGKSVEALRQNQVDIGFVAIDPSRGEGVSFTPPYVLIEGWYLVHNESPLQKNEDVDEPGIRVATCAGSAYDLFLTREIKRAQIVRAATSQQVVDTFIEQRLDVAAGVKQQLEHDAARIGGLRLLKDRFMVIKQAMAAPRSRSNEVLEYLSAFVEEMKISGFVEHALARHNIAGASVAPVEYRFDLKGSGSR